MVAGCALYFTLCSTILTHNAVTGALLEKVVQAEPLPVVLVVMLALCRALSDHLLAGFSPVLAVLL